jgi:hypothetical protein
MALVNFRKIGPEDHQIALRVIITVIENLLSYHDIYLERLVGTQYGCRLVRVREGEGKR